SLDLPNGLTSIGDFAFAGCHGFPTVSIPSTVTNIGVNAFMDCKSLTAFEVDESNPNYASLNGALFNKQQDMLLQYPGGLAGVYSIPDTVKTIRVRAFCGCDELTSINIPSSVTTIGHMAFGECKALRSIRIPGSVNSIENGAFLGCEKLKRMYFGGNAPAVEMPTFPDVSGFKIIRAPESTGFDVPPWTDYDVEIFSRRMMPID
ncbi:MAG: leucine-rich repeat domain-containing protein, partial [Opitutales bacterium]|nr:leucine-rich repeat domain-containing protein [Opitutales bacterium]